MKKNRNYKKIFVANTIQMLLLFVLAICVWFAILTIRGREIYGLPNVLIFIFVDIILYCTMKLWKKWIIQEKCDFLAQETYLISLLKQKRFKEKISLHMELLFTSLVLGKYNESKQEIEELRRLDNRLNSMQRLQLQLWQIDYMISVSETNTLKKELENVERSLAKLSSINNKVKQKIQRNINIRKYLIEEKWEDIFELIKNTLKQQRNMTAFEQISIAYIQGKCCYWLGRYEEASHELKFVVESGGNTKYVALASDLIEKIPQKNLHENIYVKRPIRVKHRLEKEIIFLIISCFFVLFFSWFNYYCSHGNSIEEAYCRRYLCAEDEITIFYQKNIGDYELVILSEDKNIAYCLLKEATGANYKIVDSFRINKNMGNGQTELMGIEMTESEKEFYQESQIKQELWEIITGFYEKNSVFYQENLEYVGISFSPMAENVTINGNPVTIEQITDSTEMPIYLWSVKNVDLKTNIQVDYAEP